MIKTDVKEVSLYRSGAFVKRYGTLDLKEGKQTAVIECNSDSIDPTTVRMSLPADVTGTNVQVELLNNDQKYELLHELQQQITDLTKKIETRTTQLELWTTNADFSNKESLSIADMSEYIEKLPERLEKIQKEITDLELQKTQLNKQLTQKKRDANCYVVTVDVEAAKSGKYPVEIRYFEHSANWNPVYEIHTEDDNDTLSIRLKGEISQGTNENWKQVKVVLFSGNPSVSGTIPELTPNRVNIYQPQIFKTAAYAGNARGMARAMDYAVEEEVAEADYEAPMMAMAAPMNDVVTASAVVKQNDTMMEYELTGLWDIKNDNKATADISTETIPCNYHIVAIPKLDDAGYLAAEVKTTDIEEILQSTANVYHKGAYLGEVYLNADMTKDTYDISLGRDESIRLKRNMKKKYTSNVVLKSQKKTEYEFELKIASTKNKSCKVTLSDQIPVSMDKSIVVEHTNISGGKLDEETGEIKWNFELEPSGTKTFNLAYSIAWPKDKMINQ